MFKEDDGGGGRLPSPGRVLNHQRHLPGGGGRDQGGREEVGKSVGCTTDFKTRWRHHHKSFNNGDYKHETVLSTHIWDCKTRGSTYSVSWKILDRGQPFNPVTKICKLCVRERFYILRKPHLATLNHRQEIGTFCPHVRTSLLRNIKKVKVPD